MKKSPFFYFYQKVLLFLIFLDSASIYYNYVKYHFFLFLVCCLHRFRPIGVVHSLPPSPPLLTSTAKTHASMWCLSHMLCTLPLLTSLIISPLALPHPLHFAYRHEALPILVTSIFMSLSSSIVPITSWGKIDVHNMLLRAYKMSKEWIKMTQWVGGRALLP